MVRITRFLPLAAMLLVVACSGAGSDRRLRVGEEPGNQAGGGAGNAGSAGGAGSGGIGVGDQALSVRVEDITEMAIDVITLSCAGDCADVEAVARGGNPPYTFEWEDGSTDAARTVCLDASTTLSVSATDTAVDSTEFAYEAHTAQADVRADVLSCADSGTADGGAASDLCISNPSFEGTPGSTPPDAPPWVSNCPGAFEGIADWTRLWSESSMLLNQTLPSPAASDGSTYLLIGANGGVGNQDVSQLLCAPLRAGETYVLKLDLAPPTFFGTDSPIAAGGALEIWAGATAACAKDELLWTSPPITSLGWSTHCVELKPTQDAASLTLVPIGGGGANVDAVLVDDLVAADACP